MQKPDSMKKFDMLFWASIALSVVSMILNWDFVTETMQAQMADAGAALPQDAMMGIVVGSFVFGIGIYVALWFLISKLRIEFVKWIVIVLIVWGLLQMPAAIALTGGLKLTHVVDFVSTALMLAGIWMLFRADSRAWFAAKKDAQ